jgi:thiosulfate dehydrogenase [quinone] large subunit
MEAIDRRHSHERRRYTMTRRGTYILTAIAAALFVFLNWAFADGMFSLDGDALWNTETYASSTIFTYLLLAIIILAGIYQAQRMPEQPTARPIQDTTTPGQTDDPVTWKLLLGNAYWAIFWLPIRFFIGIEWLAAGEHKLRDDAWMDGGTALKSYWERQLTVPEGRPAAPAGTYGWFEQFLRYMLDHQWYDWFGPLIAIGEFLVGLGLIVGALVGIAAFFGTLMNFNFMLAGASSSNPVMFGLTVFLVLAWKVAGYWGLDRVLLPALGAPWKFGTLFTGGEASTAPSGRKAPA